MTITLFIFSVHFNKISVKPFFEIQMKAHLKPHNILMSQYINYIF